MGTAVDSTPLTAPDATFDASKAIAERANGHEATHRISQKRNADGCKGRVEAGEGRSERCVEGEPRHTQRRRLGQGECEREVGRDVCPKRQKEQKQDEGRPKIKEHICEHEGSGAALK